MSENLEMAVEGFLAHKRGIGRKYHSEEHELRLLLRFAGEHRARRLDQLNPALLEEFLTSRPRSRPPRGPSCGSMELSLVLAHSRRP